MSPLAHNTGLELDPLNSLKTVDWCETSLDMWTSVDRAKDEKNVITYAVIGNINYISFSSLLIYAIYA